MVTSTFDPNDPRLTAWLLGELPASEREAFERYLDTHPEARAEIELLRGACEQMRGALAAEPSPALSDAERAGVLAAAERPPLESGKPATITPNPAAIPTKRWHSLIAVMTTIAGCALVIALVNQTPQERDTAPAVQRNRFTSLEREPESVALQSSHKLREVAAQATTRESERARLELRSAELALSDQSEAAGQPMGFTHSSPDGESSGREGEGRGQGGFLSGRTERSRPAPQTVGATLRKSGSAASITPRNTIQGGEVEPIDSLLTSPQPVAKDARTLRTVAEPVGTVARGITEERLSARRKGPADRSPSISTSRGGEKAGEQLREFESESRFAAIDERLDGDRIESIKGYRFIQDGPRAGAEEYAAFADNPFSAPQKAPLSTFGVDVDTASYANVRRFLTNGQLPPPQAVRIEEMLNYFRYDDPAPQGDVPFSVTVEMWGCPWKADHRLVRIGLSGREIPKGDRPAANLVFLVDVSGSMQSENKLPLVKHSLKLLLSKLDERDRLAIVTYSDTAKVVMPSTVVANRDQIQTTIDSLVAAGSTNGADGIRLAYNEAVHHFVDKGINRVVLCTDGDFNVGTTNDDELVKLIEERRRSQVFFSVYGYGMGNLKDGKLEKLADHGNGHYGYIDGPVEAQKSFVEDAEANLVTIAQDVKIQVEFNPTWVGAYRLIGYENRVLAAADFRNDKVDAGDIGAGHRVTALYEIVPPTAVAEVSSEERPKLRYSTPQTPAEGPLAHETLAVRLRYKTPGEETSKEFEVQYIEDPRPVSKNMQWSSAVAAFGMLLRQSPHRGEVSIPMILELAEASVGEDPQGHRHEFVELVRKAAPAFTHQPTASVKSVDGDQPVTAADAEQIASLKGKYSNLLRVIRAEGDRELYGEVSEYGRWEGRDYQDHTNLPQGYWVYVAPNWYIWGDMTK